MNDNKKIIIFSLIGVLCLVGIYFIFKKPKPKTEEKTEEEKVETAEERAKREEQEEKERQRRKEEEETNRRLLEAAKKKPPIVRADSISMFAGKEAFIDVISNDEINGDTKSLAISVEPKYGTAIVVGSKIKYVPNLGFPVSDKGFDIFKYKVENEHGATEGSVAIEVMKQWCTDKVRDFKKFDLLNNDELDNIVKVLRSATTIQQFSFEEISYGAAMLKAFDIELSVASFVAYRDNINEFREAIRAGRIPDIKRKSLFSAEIRDSVYKTGELKFC